MLDKPLNDELLTLLDALCEENLSKDQGQRLREILRTNPEACVAYVHYMDLHASLTQDTAPLVRVDHELRDRQPFQLVSDAAAREKARPRWRKGIESGANEGGVSAVPAAAWTSKRVMTPLWRHPAVLLLVLLLGIGAGYVGGRRIESQRSIDFTQFTESPLIGRPDASEGASPYVAKLVNVTNCRWDQVLSTADLTRGSMVRSGESLHLLEGVAEINSTLPNGGMAKLQLEGPLAMTLTSRGMPSLLYGRLTGSFASDYDQFTLDTPLGRVVVSGDASIGMMAAANSVELHVFSGAATLELWGADFKESPKQYAAAAGSSLHARVAPDGKVAVDQGASKESGFMTPAALAASQLLISKEYVSTVLKSEPVAYWRFEGDVDGLMRNEVADRYHCRMVGDAVGWHGGEQNCTAEFGLTAGPGYLISDDVLDGVIGDDYSVEAWVKPTYYHHGALVSLIDWSESESPLDKHRFLLELCGPNPGVPRTIFRSVEFFPGSIRFIHQTSECYSSSRYRVRSWQHIAAVREQSVMRLYVDGAQMAASEDATSLGKGLRVLMGQQFPRNPHLKDDVTARLFVGEMDEVALYNHALSDKEIQRRVQLARPDLEVGQPVAP